LEEIPPLSVEKTKEKDEGKHVCYTWRWHLTSTAIKAKESKAPQPSKLKREAYDVDRSLKQFENVFSIEKSSFVQGTIKIHYTGNLLEGTAAFNWYEAYQNLIDQKVADRADGQHEQLDSHWAT